MWFNKVKKKKNNIFFTKFKDLQDQSIVEHVKYVFLNSTIIVFGKYIKKKRIFLFIKYI